MLVGLVHCESEDGEEGGRCLLPDSRRSLGVIAITKKISSFEYFGSEAGDVIGIVEQRREMECKTTGESQSLNQVMEGCLPRTPDDHVSSLRLPVKPSGADWTNRE